MIDQEQIEARISSVYYEQPTHVGNGTRTICHIVLDNGFSVLGSSATIDVEAFNVQVGREIAYKNAFEQLWQLFGFLAMEDRYQKR